MITVNMEKAKQVCHTMRRQSRTKEFEPLDAIIAKQIPGADVAAVEAQRQAIRDKYAEFQDAINQAKNPDELTVLLSDYLK
jgi:hypothetical protein